MPEVTVTNLVKRFGPTTVLEQVSFTVKDGEFFTLLGASGCGKSTTLNCIAGLEQPTGGAITVGTTTFVDTAAKLFLPPERRNLGMVFQSYALWPHMSIEANLALPLKLRKVRRQDREARIGEALEKVGLTKLRGRYPHQLSGGQQQRVALARALVYSPTVLLLDEPLSNLDAKLREQARAWLKRLQEDLGITTVYVTHDQDEALALSDRIAVMSEGHMLQVGTPRQIYETPATPEVAAFVGRCNFLVGRVEQHRDGHCRVRLDCSGDIIEVTTDQQTEAGQEVTVAVRPERLDVHAPSGPNTVAAEVLTSSYVGSRYEYQIKLGTHVVQVESLRGGLTGPVTLTFAREAALLYPTAAVPSAEADELLTLTS
nr:ABC transporter ATP-binding protein [Micromonospora sp. DSM 115978]